jgi:nucleotide-binding universal stress UspA family protein
VSTGHGIPQRARLRVATEQLSEARDLLASAPAKVAVQYILGRGSFTRAVIAVVEAEGADVIVLSGQRGGRLRRRVARDRAKLLRKRTSAAVIVAPDLAGR